MENTGESGVHRRPSKNLRTGREGSSDTSPPTRLESTQFLDSIPKEVQDKIFSFLLFFDTVPRNIHDILRFGGGHVRLKHFAELFSVRSGGLRMHMRRPFPTLCISRKPCANGDERHMVEKLMLSRFSLSEDDFTRIGKQCRNLKHIEMVSILTEDEKRMRFFASFGNHLEFVRVSSMTKKDLIQVM